MKKAVPSTVGRTVSPHAVSKHAMNDKPLVSVIIIFLNAEKFLQEAIDSVFSQTYSNWELLLVDDGSTDASTRIAREVAERFPGKVQYLEHAGHRNRGMSASRNWGIAHARGKYVAFLDADDVWLPQKLEEQVAILEAHPEVAMVYGPSEFWFGWTGKPEDVRQDYLQQLDVSTDKIIAPPKLFALFLRNPSISPAPSGILVRRETLQSVGGFEGTMPGMFDDQGFYTKICTRVPVYVSSRCWYRYRRHPDAYCVATLAQGRHHHEREVYLNWVEAYLTEHRLGNAEVWAALRRELRPYRHPIWHRIASRVERTVQRAVVFTKKVVRRLMPQPIAAWLKSKLRLRA